MNALPAIGIIAGKGLYPALFIENARQKAPHTRLCMAAFYNETSPELEKKVDNCQWMRVGQLGKLIAFFKKQQVSHVVMVGQITPKNLFEFRPDIRTLLLLNRLKQKNAETLFGGVADELHKEGITVLNATTFLEEFLANQGLLAGPKLKNKEDALYAFFIAKQTSALDIGQTVLVRHGTVLAVEAFEGTNACIDRAGRLAKQQSITLAKVSKPRQDFRFDVPVIGPDTITHCASAGVCAIVLEAHKTLLLDWKHIQKACKQHKVSLYALAEEEQKENAL